MFFFFFPLEFVLIFFLGFSDFFPRVCSKVFSRVF